MAESESGIRITTDTPYLALRQQAITRKTTYSDTYICVFIEKSSNKNVNS